MIAYILIHYAKEHQENSRKFTSGGILAHHPGSETILG